MLYWSDNRMGMNPSIIYHLRMYPAPRTSVRGLFYFQRNGEWKMEWITLIAWVFVLGLRHGLDADHLACIDGMVRSGWHKNSPTARWAGTLFSFGHGLAVAIIGIILGSWAHGFTFPAYFDTVVVWISAGSLFVIGTMNLIQLLQMTTRDGYTPVGLKGKWIPRFARNSTNPYMIVLIGAMMALAADTVSQTAVWALAAGQTTAYMPAVLGAVFMLGMMTTDTLDSVIMHKMLRKSGRVGQRAAILMGWLIVLLAYGVSFLQLLAFFKPWAEVDSESLGIGILSLIGMLFLVMLLAARKNGKKATRYI